ncbi:hypothetical protein RSOLAG22IIIB_12932 [Rhizoctonia solani]|uniref:Uncharacterized protein n=1 Tax=Rhizoctonia solani TaxID=456999 RepID=A0A0K6GHX6_9AGAM|nr:hypothetical protein RSOLAG22IIIB_12932 [Rhizoctonia solani]
MPPRRKRAASEPTQPDEEVSELPKKRGRPPRSGTSARRSVSATQLKAKAKAKTTPTLKPKTSQGVKSKKMGPRVEEEGEYGSLFVPMEPESDDSIGKDTVDGLISDSEPVDIECDEDKTPVTSLPVSVRLRLPAPASASANTKASSSNTGARGTPKQEKEALPLELTSSSSDSEEKKGLKKRSKKKAKKSAATKLTFGKRFEEYSDSDELELIDDDLLVPRLKVAFELDDAKDDFFVEFDINYKMFRYEVANQLNRVQEEMRLAYTLPDTPKGERRHLKSEENFAAMMSAALGWIESKASEIREKRRKQKGKDDNATIRKLLTQLTGPAVTIFDLGETGKKNLVKLKLQGARAPPAETPGAKHNRLLAQIRRRVCSTCGKNCAIIYVPGSGPDHRELTEECKLLWASLASKSEGTSSYIGPDPPQEVVARMSDMSKDKKRASSKTKAEEPIKPNTPALQSSTFSHGASIEPGMTQPMSYMPGPGSIVMPYYPNLNLQQPFAPLQAPGYLAAPVQPYSFQFPMTRQPIIFTSGLGPWQGAYPSGFGVPGPASNPSFPPNFPPYNPPFGFQNPSDNK